ncbi:AlpA family transcriptional regulator [Nostocoides sp. HKS02]|uniref:helix-turn-helix transcriptional regulator n=1 Tax=Nostocoides sp. HKS02 TaxID=1813880 RepID=UPI0012B4CBE0|nr:helix-turn-helix domain-containing protein [Tetrasphaera sp. HKS02]QGN59085.1 DNA-binding protein [Tetrasphaera sp. HKS02]
MPKDFAPAGASASVPRLLTTAEVADLLHVNASTLCRWRQQGMGPRVAWLSPAIPRYQLADVAAWIERAAS